MGLFDFFRRRAERESAVPPSASVPPVGGETAEAQPVVGQQVEGLGAPGLTFQQGMQGLEAVGGLGGLFSLIGKAAAQGNINVQVSSDSQTIDMTGAEGLREEMLEIMRRHGIDPESGAAENVDASAMPQMQQEMLEALSRHGLDFSAGGAGVQAPSDDDA